MGCAPMSYVLWKDFMTVDPKDTKWFNRDRFVLSAGHGSMLNYSLLHLMGYDLSVSAGAAQRTASTGTSTSTSTSASASTSTSTAPASLVLQAHALLLASQPAWGTVPPRSPTLPAPCSLRLTT